MNGKANSQTPPGTLDRREASTPVSVAFTVWHALENEGSFQNVLPCWVRPQRTESLWDSLGAAFSMSFFAKIIDVLLDCSFAMETCYYLEDEELWKEHRLVCRRCGKLDQLSIEEANDFWDASTTEESPC